MTLDDDIRVSAERGTQRGADAIWAAAQRRHRHQSLLVGTALVLFVLVAVAALVLTLSGGADDSGPPVATTPVVTLPVFDIESGGEVCDPDGFCVELTDNGTDTYVRLKWQGEYRDVLGASACRLAMDRGVSLATDSPNPDDPAPRMWAAGISPPTSTPVTIPGVELHQLRVRYDGATFHAFYASQPADPATPTISLEEPTPETRQFIEKVATALNDAADPAGGQCASDPEPTTTALTPPPVESTTDPGPTQTRLELATLLEERRAADPSTSAGINGFAASGTGILVAVSSEDAIPAAENWVRATIHTILSDHPELSSYGDLTLEVRSLDVELQ